MSQSGSASRSLEATPTVRRIPLQDAFPVFLGKTVFQTAAMTESADQAAVSQGHDGLKSEGPRGNQGALSNAGDRGYPRTHPATHSEGGWEG